MELKFKHPTGGFYSNGVIEVPCTGTIGGNTMYVLVHVVHGMKSAVCFCSHMHTIILPPTARIPDRTFTARYLGSATMDVGGSRHASLVAALKKAMAQQVHGMTISEKMTIVVRADGIK